MPNNRGTLHTSQSDEFLKENAIEESHKVSETVPLTQPSTNISLLQFLLFFCKGAKELIAWFCLKIPNHDENILAPKSKDCGWRKKKTPLEDTWFITPLTNKIYSLHPPAITQMVRKLALCRDVDSGMNINMRQM